MNDQKKSFMKKLCNKEGIISALAIDQRGSLKKMVKGYEGDERDSIIKNFKKEVAKNLTPYASAILLDPLYGLDAVSSLDENCGLILAYEVTGYDKNEKGRIPKLEKNWSVHRLKEQGADGIKILLYYDVDEGEEINTVKKAFIERVGSECDSLGLPFFLEIITYDSNIEDSKSKEYAKVKPHKVNRAIEDFSDPRYKVDVFKLEVPVNMKYVQGYSQDYVYTKEKAGEYFKEQSDLCKVPFIFLSAGVTNQEFLDTLEFSKEAGSKFNGVLCGRATWADGVDPFVKSKTQGIEWIQTQGKENIEKVNKTLAKTATAINIG